MNVFKIRNRLLGPELIKKCLSQQGISEEDLKNRHKFLIKKGVLNNCDLDKFKNLCDLSEIPPCFHQNDLEILQQIEKDEIGNLVNQFLYKLKRNVPRDIKLICFVNNISTFINVSNYYEFNIFCKILQYKSILINLIYRESGNNSLILLESLNNIYQKNNTKLNEMYSYFFNEKKNSTIQKEVFYTPEPLPILVFLKFIQYYDNLVNGNIYFLGDSLYKFKIMYDLLKPENNSKLIKFSGNKFLSKEVENIFSENNINTDFVDNLKKNAEEYYFKNQTLIDNIFDNLKKRKKIVIFDYLTSGVSLLTLIEFFKYLNENVIRDNLKIENFNDVILKRVLFVNLHSYIETKRIISILEGRINFVTYEMDIDPFFFYHFINSDKFLTSNLCSRCVPKYSPDLWKENIEVYKEEMDYLNYLGCNISNLEIIIFLNFILKNKLDLDKIIISKGSTNDKKCEAITINKDNLVEGLNIIQNDNKNEYNIYYKIDFLR